MEIGVSLRFCAEVETWRARPSSCRRRERCRRSPEVNHPDPSLISGITAGAGGRTERLEAGDRQEQPAHVDIERVVSKLNGLGRGHAADVAGRSEADGSTP